jgi:plasmid maintenance system antidote protein VapI
VTLQTTAASPTVDTQTVLNSGNNLPVKERSIYPNLKLRVYTTGMRQNRLAKLVGIDEAYLSRIINGVRVPGKQMQEQIAQVLGCDPDWLFEQTTIQVSNFGAGRNNAKAVLDSPNI